MGRKPLHELGGRIGLAQQRLCDLLMLDIVGLVDRKRCKVAQARLKERHPVARLHRKTQPLEHSGVQPAQGRILFGKIVDRNCRHHQHGAQNDRRRNQNFRPKRRVAQRRRGSESCAKVHRLLRYL